MKNMIEIDNLSMPELDPYARLTRAQLLRCHAPGEGLFIAESAKVIEAALDAGYEPVSLLMERKQAEALEDSLLKRCGDIPVYTAAREVLAGLTGYALTRGVLCVMRRRQPAGMQAVCCTARRVAVLESIVDTTNMGAIFRCAAALHMDAVLLTQDCCDPLSRRAARVSMGSVFKVPWAYIPGDWQARLKGMGFATAAMALDERALCVDHPALKAQEKLAIVLGTEGDGLAPSTIARCDYTVMIPMSHDVDSLNVAAAAAVAFWELGRVDAGI